MAEMAGARETCWQEALARLTECFASTEPTPGGGSAAGAAGALGCALAQMATGISLGSKKADEGRRQALAAAREEFGRLGMEFRRLTGEDAAVFERVMAAYRLPKDDPGRGPRLQESLKAAAGVPLDTARAALAALKKAALAKGQTLGTVTSDMSCAEHLLRAAGLCALENIEVNAALIKDSSAASALRCEAESVRKALEP
jgi:methenyltetrahydrofolate cyclohydrolase